MHGFLIAARASGSVAFQTAASIPNEARQISRGQQCDAREALRQLLPLAESAAKEINERWAVGAVQRADMALGKWSNKRGNEQYG